MKIFPSYCDRVFPIVQLKGIRRHNFDADTLAMSECLEMDIDELKQKWDDDLHHNSDLWYLAKLREKLNHLL